MARAESITFEEFRTRFSTEESCRVELFRLRFPNGFSVRNAAVQNIARFAGGMRSSAAPDKGRSYILCPAALSR